MTSFGEYSLSALFPSPDDALIGQKYWVILGYDSKCMPSVSFAILHLSQ